MMRQGLALGIVLAALVPGSHAQAQNCDEAFKEIVWVMTPTGPKRPDQLTDLNSVVSLFAFHFRDSVNLEKHPQLLRLVNQRYRDLFEAQQSSAAYDRFDSAIGSNWRKGHPFAIEMQRIRVLIDNLPRRYKSDPRILHFLRMAESNTWHQDPTSVATFLWLTHASQLSNMGGALHARAVVEAAGISTKPKGSDSNERSYSYSGYGTPPAIAAARLAGHQRREQEHRNYWNRVEQNFEYDYNHADPVTRGLMDLLPGLYLRDD